MVSVLGVASTEMYREVLKSSLQARPPRTGWVPGSYFETPTNFYKQRRQTRELSGLDMKLTEEQEAILNRE